MLLGILGGSTNIRESWLLYVPSYLQFEVGIECGVSVGARGLVLVEPILEVVLR
jgi:hypothetical protein